MTEINSIGIERGPDGILRHIPQTCGVCFLQRSAQYGRDGKWYCLLCWDKSGVWKTRLVEIDK